MLLVLWSGVMLLAAAHIVATERQAARRDMAVEALQTELSLLHVAHREDIRKLTTDHRAEVQVMCQRIQAPDIAVVEHQQANAEDGPSFPMTDQETAAQAENAAFIAEVERRENESLFR